MIPDEEGLCRHTRRHHQPPDRLARTDSMPSRCVDAKFSLSGIRRHYTRYLDLQYGISHVRVVARRCRHQRSTAPRAIRGGDTRRRHASTSPGKPGACSSSDRNSSGHDEDQHRGQKLAACLGLAEIEPAWPAWKTVPTAPSRASACGQAGSQLPATDHGLPRLIARQQHAAAPKSVDPVHGLGPGNRASVSFCTCRDRAGQKFLLAVTRVGQ